MARRLRFRRQPVSGVKAGERIPNVEVEFLEDNEVVPVSGPVEMSLGIAPPGAVLQGNKVRQFVEGVAVFPGLSLDVEGDYTLVAKANEDDLVFPDDGLRKVLVTVPASRVSEALAGFPVMLRLSSMPSEFWNRVKPDGGDLRAYSLTASPIPMDLVRIDPDAQDGVIFVRLNLSPIAGGAFYLRFGDHSLERLPPEDPVGRNAVWADFHRVFLLGESYDDRTGKAAPSEIQVGGRPDLFRNVSTGPILGDYQGLAYDGSNYFLTAANQIRKLDSNWGLTEENLDPCGDVGGGTNHVGDPCAHGGVLYAPLEHRDGASRTKAHLAKFDLDTLQLISTRDVEENGHDVSGCCIGPDGSLYVTSYLDGSQVFQYDSETLDFVGALPLSTDIPKAAGITFWRGALWVASEEWGRVVRVELDGRVWPGGVWGEVGGALRGVTHDGDGLLVLHDLTGAGSSTGKRIKPLDVEAGGGADIWDLPSWIEVPADLHEDFTMGVTLVSGGLESAFGVTSYASTETVSRVVFGQQGTGGGRPGAWDPQNLWIQSQDTGYKYPVNDPVRAHTVYRGSSYRRLFFDGAQVREDPGITPVDEMADIDSFLVGRSSLSNVSNFMGGVGFAYLRLEALTPGWISTEFANLRDPGFLVIGQVERG